MPSLFPSTWVLDEPNAARIVLTSQGFSLSRRQQIVQQLEHLAMYHPDTWTVSTDAHPPLSGTSVADFQEGSGFVFRRDRLLAAGCLSMPLQKVSDWPWLESNTAMLIQAIPVEEVSLPEVVEEPGKPVFKVEHAGSILLWKPIPDPAAKRKAQSLAEAVKRRFAKAQKASLEEIMVEIRGRPW